MQEDFAVEILRDVVVIQQITSVKYAEKYSYSRGPGLRGGERMQGWTGGRKSTPGSHLPVLQTMSTEVEVLLQTSGIFWQHFEQFGLTFLLRHFFHVLSVKLCDVRERTDVAAAVFVLDKPKQISSNKLLSYLFLHKWGWFRLTEGLHNTVSSFALKLLLTSPVGSKYPLSGIL